MNLKTTIIAASSAVAMGALSLWGFQQYQNREMISGKIAKPMHEGKEAFDNADISIEESRKIKLEVINIKPSSEGVVKVKQIAITFNKPMVALGDFEKSAQNLPITIIPEVPCQWRWLNRLSLACQLDEALPESNEYHILVSGNMEAFDKTTLGREYKEKFSTARWKVVNEFIEWKGPDEPIVQWVFNQPMSLESLQKNISSVCGRVKITSAPQNNSNDQFSMEGKSFLLSFEQSLGLGKYCNLKLKEEAKSNLGSLHGHGHFYKLTTYPKFSIDETTCGYPQQYGNPGKKEIELSSCDPNRGVTIRFTTPVLSKDLAGNIEIEPFFGWSKGGDGSPEYFRKNPLEEKLWVHLKRPLNGRDTHVIKFKDIKDKFGRKLRGPNTVKVVTTDYDATFNLNTGFGVLEKEGPHKVAYDSVNIESFKLDYYHTKSPQELELWDYYHNQYEYCNSKLDTSKFPRQSYQIKTNAQLNVPRVGPIDLDKVMKGPKYGLFFGSVSDHVFFPGIEKTKYFDYSSCQNFFVVVTDLGITSKIGFYDSGVWVHSIKTGQPLANIKVHLRGKNKILSEGITDKNGFVSLSGAEKWDSERSNYGRWGEELFVVAESKDDMSMLPYFRGAAGLEPYNFSDTENYQSRKLRKSHNYIVHAITDRPLYQPNQEVKIKIFARNWQPRTFGLQPSAEIEITVRDSRGKEVFKSKEKLSDYGTASVDLKIESGASLGSYSINGTIGENWSRTIGYFNVQEFTLPAFKVNVVAKKEKFKVGSVTEFKTEARYHFGGALASAKGKSTLVFQEKTWKPTKSEWESYNFNNDISFEFEGDNKRRSPRRTTLEESDINLDKKGDAYKSFILSGDTIRSYGHLQFESKFKDDKGKTIAGRAQAEVFYSDFLMGMRLKEWAYEVGKTISPEVVALDLFENQIEGKKVILKLIHRSYETVRNMTSGNYFGYETKTSDQVVDECQFELSKKNQTCGLKAETAGSYHILAESLDSQKRGVRSTLHVYVTGSEYIGWYRDDHDRIDLVPDKGSYRVGDTLSVLVKSPYEEVEGIFTLERFGILKQFRRKISGGAQIVKIPIDSKDYAPGFYLSVQLIKGRVSDKVEGNVDLGKPSFKMGFTKIKVVNPDSLIEVSSSTDKKEYEPGQTVKAKVRVRSQEGKRKTELSIAVVDEKILQLAGDYENKFDLHEKFYQVPGVDVMTSQMLSYLIGRRHFGRKGAPEGGDGDGLNVRKNFLPLAYWNPSIETDSSGRAEFEFQVPDNLTGWRLLIVAVDKEHRFGFGGSSFKSTKKIMIEPGLPSFLTEGDKLKARFSVFNRIGKKSEIEGTLKFSGVLLESPATSTLPIENDGKGIFDWLVTVPFDSSGVEMTVKASEKEGKNYDAAQFKIPVRPFVSFETFADYGSTTKNQISLPLKVPADIRPNLGGLEVILSSSLITHLDDAMKYAINYPYACWEQKLSKMLMLSNYISLKDYVSLPDVKRDPEKWIQELIVQMPNYQYSNGGMAFWKPHYKTVDSYLSVFTALGVIWLNQNDLKVPVEPTNAVFKYTEDLLAGKVSFSKWYSPGMRSTVLAMATYVKYLRGKDVTSEVNKLYEDSKNMSLFGKSFLWSATAGNKKLKLVSEKLKENIFSQSDITSGKIRFSEKLDGGYSRILQSEARTNCSLLISLLHHDSKSPFVQPLVRWILTARKSNRWNNTQENIYCLKALKDYASIYEKENPDFSVVSSIPGTKKQRAKFRGFRQEPVVHKATFEKMNKQGKLIEVDLEKRGTGRLYYTTRMKVAPKKVRLDPINAGMAVQRIYYLKGKSGQWQRQQNKIKMKRGDLIKIELNVSAMSSRVHVALADSLPAGLEPLNTSLAATSLSDASDDTREDEANRWWYIYGYGGFYHSEMRLQGAQFFAEHLTNKKYTKSYIAQAIAVGEFNVPPAIVEEMYDPEVYGKSRPAKFIVSE